MKPFTSTKTDSVMAQGELRLIALIQRWLGAASPRSPFGIGDDCAVIPSSGHHQLVTTDPVIYGHHFDDSVPPASVGAKLLKRNLSDIAAMGGQPVAAVVALALAPNTRVEWLRGFYLGLARCARQYGVKIVGGDITQGTAGFLGAFLTLHGQSAGHRVVTRTGARLGDHILVTGRLGGSLAGHHYRFSPRLAEGRWLAQQPEVRAMMDVSDGIAKDIRSLTPKGLIAALEPKRVPVSTAARAAAKRSKRPAWEHALIDGEDYELLFVLDRQTDVAAFQTRWRRRFSIPLTPLGQFARQLTSSHVNLHQLSGYEHLR